MQNKAFVFIIAAFLFVSAVPQAAFAAFGKAVKKDDVFISQSDVKALNMIDISSKIMIGNIDFTTTSISAAHANSHESGSMPAAIKVQNDTKTFFDIKKTPKTADTGFFVSLLQVNEMTLNSPPRSSAILYSVNIDKQYLMLLSSLRKGSIPAELNVIMQVNSGFSFRLV